MGDGARLTFGARVQAPQPAQQPSSSEEHADIHADMPALPVPTPAQRSLQRSLTQIPIQQPAHKVPRLSRISSYIGLGAAAKGQSPITSDFAEIAVQRGGLMKSGPVFYHEAAHDKSTGVWRAGLTTESEFAYRESDRTWHSPTLQQMMETVGCVLMTNGISEPLPRHLNGFVAGMIEEFRVYLSRTKRVQNSFDELRQTREKEVQEFAAMAEEWKVRENAFDSEIDRLEHIIAATQKGAESVIMARAGSVCKRNDGEAFRAKLKRLRKNEDEILQRDQDRHVIKDDTRSSVVMTADDSLSRTIAARPRAILDHNADAYLSKQLLNKDLTSKRIERLKYKHDVDQQVAAARQFSNNTGTGRPRLPCDTDSRKASARKSDSSSSSSTTRSRPSASLIAQGLHTERAAQSSAHVTPHTTPPHTGPVKTPGRSAFRAIQELVQRNGGLPEEAIDDDESSYAPSFVPPRHQRYSFNAGDDKPAVNVCSKAAPSNVTSEDAETGIQVRERACDQKIAAVNQDSRNVASNGLERKESNESQSSSSSKGSQKPKSSILLSMRRNLAEERKRDAENATEACDGSPGSTASSRGSSSKRSSPTRKAPSGGDPFPDEATKYAYRRTRLVTNAHIRARTCLKDEELVAMALDEAIRPGIGLPAAALRQRVVPRRPAPQRPAPQRPAPQRPAPQRPAPQRPAPQRPAPQRPAPQRPAVQRTALQRAAPHRSGHGQRARGPIGPPPGFEHVVPGPRRPIRPPPGFETVFPRQYNYNAVPTAANEEPTHQA